MSYILDALRRADAERERGEVPGLQSQQQHAALDDDAPVRRLNPMLLAVVALALALVVAVGWNLWGARDPAPVAAAPAPAPAVIAAPVAAAPPLATAAAVLPSPATAPAPAPVTAPATTAPVRPAPRRAAASATSGAPVNTAAAPNPATPSRADAGSRPAASAAARGGPENRVFTTAELPEDIRRELPKVAIGGASYSSDAASRMVIINGQVFHEGDKVATGLVLEKIKLKAAVLAFKGWRYQIDY